MRTDSTSTGLRAIRSSSRRSTGCPRQNGELTPPGPLVLDRPDQHLAGQCLSHPGTQGIVHHTTRAFDRQNLADGGQAGENAAQMRLLAGKLSSGRVS